MEANKMDSAKVTDNTTMCGKMLLGITKRDRERIMDTKVNETFRHHREY